MVENILFDFDGTLVDTSEGIIKSMHHAYDCLGYERISDERIKAVIGPPLQEMFRQLLPEATGEIIETGVQKFREWYRTHGVDEAEPFPYVPEGLKRLREKGKRLFIVTSKPEVFVREISCRYSMDGLFHDITATSVSGKSESKAVRMGTLMKRYSMLSESTVMVGDRHEDAEAAAANGVRCIGVGYGYDERDKLEKAACVKIAESFYEVCGILEKDIA